MVTYVRLILAALVGLALTACGSKPDVACPPRDKVVAAFPDSTITSCTVVEKPRVVGVPKVDLPTDEFVVTLKKADSSYLELLATRDGSKVVPTCPVEPLEKAILAAYPKSRIIGCSQVSTAAVGGKPMPELDEFVIKVRRADGASIQLHATRNPFLKDASGSIGKLEESTKILAHWDRVDSHGPGMALLFWMFAGASVGGALFVVTRRNLIAAVMGMVGSFVGIAAIYMMLYAHFLAVVQMLVYAGAIMVLFVFVIMILNRPEDEPVAPTGRIGYVIGGGAIVYLVGRLVMMLMKVQVPGDAKTVAARLAAPGPTTEGHEWGTVKAVGTDLFGPGLFPFEAISVLLLVAVVGAIAIARPHDQDDKPPTKGDGVQA